ncbi:MAG: NosD domain-containing protein, partial [Candidatus Aenigmatarchaeota archaeon]
MSVEERIVDILSKHPEGLTITNISKELNIHRNTTSKYIFALAKAGIIEQRRIGKVALCSLKKQKKGFFLGKKSIAKLSLAILALMIILIFLFHYTIPIKGSVDKIFNFTELNGYRLEIELEKQKFFTNELIKISGFFGLTDKTPIENQSLSLTLISSDSITNQIVSTDWNGTFSLSFNLNQGNYTIVASSGELETYLNFEVLEIPFNITLEKSVFKANETVSIFIQGETNKEFTLEIFGQEITENFTLTTDEKGFYIFNKTFPPGNYSARILSNEVSFEVLEEKEEIKLELISKEFYYLDENITLIVSGTPDQKFDLSVLKENLTVFSFLGQTNSSGLSEIYFKLFEKGNYSAILKYEEKEELTIFEVLERIENITEEILTRNITLTVVSLEQEKAEINKPVKWKKVLRVINPTEKDAEIEFNLELELPENSFNISVQEKESKAIKKLEGKSFKDKLKPKESKEYVLTYYTEAPQAYEEVLNKYRKIIRVNSSLHYENVLAYTEVEKSPRNSVRLYWLVNSERIDVTFNESFKVKLLDLDNDELIEKVEWLIPYLSEQVFEISITILNPYTYLRDGETWIVAFNTTGKADLIISSPNANWREMFADDENTFDEMEFLDIKCGNNSVKNSLQLIDELNNTYNYSRLTEKDSVKVKKFLIKDYSCEETGYFINRMFRAGYAVLEFEFAGQKAYAYDPTPCEVNISSCSDLNQANTYYCLNQSILDSSSKSCINISANNITLDCLGNTIDGNDTSITYGINISRSSSQATNITVKNCIVTDWYYGIRLLKANNNTLINLTSEENMKSISVSESNYNLIKDVKVFCTNYCEDGISIYWSNYTIISDSEFFSLSRAGVYLLSSFNNTLINLTSKDSLYGINLEGSSNNTLMNSTLDYCFESGLSLSSSSFNTILNNKISNSLFYGITLDYSHSNILANNVIFSNGLANIYFYNSYDNKIYNNLFNNSNNFYFEGTLYNNYFNTTNQSGQRIYSPGNYIGGNYYTNYGQCQGSVIACEDITDPDNCNSQLDCYWDNGCQGDALNCSEIGTQAFCENQPGCYWNSSMVNVGYSDICQDYNRDGFCDYPYDALSEGACEIGINCSNNVDYLPLSDEYLPCDVFISSCSELTQPNTYYCLNQSILDSSSKSCINVSANNITLDCLGNTIDGTDASSTYGINISRSSSQATNITVKNCIVTDWSDGIYLHNSANNKLINITVNSSTNRAIFLDASSSNLLEDIKAYNNYRGLYIYYSSDNQVKDSIIQESSRHDFLIGADSDTSCNNYIYNITGSGGRPIKYFNYSVNLQNEVLSALILCNADFSNITNVTINGSPTIDNNALFVTRTENSRFVRIQSSDNLVGIYLFSSSNNQIIDSTLNYNNAWAGVFLENSNNNTVINSTLHNNMFGISMSSSSDNTIINSSIAFSFNADYHFYSGVCLGNNFTNTNFTAPRKIYFEAPSSNWFNYNNRTDIELWLKTRVSSAAAINRSLIKWTQQEIKWNENASTTITAYYEINGLYPNQEYKIYNGSQLVYTQNTTSTGNLTFNLTITTDIREITVNTTADLEPPLIQFVPPTPANNSIVQNNFVYVNTTITDASNTSAFIDWNYSLVGYWSFDWYNSSGVFDNSTYNNFGFFQGGLGIDNITTGQYGKGIRFSGNDADFINVSDKDELDGFTTEATWEFWVYLYDANKRACILNKYQTSNNQRAYMIEHDGTYGNAVRLFASANGITYGQWNYDIKFNPAQWYHV